MRIGDLDYPDEGDLAADSARPSSRWTAPPRPIEVPKGANTDPQPEHAPELEDENREFPIALGTNYL